MKLVETAKFKRLRRKIKEEHERKALKEAVVRILKDQGAGKKLKGEFRDLRVPRYTVEGQSRRLIYKIEPDSIVLFSFGPREGIYK